MIKQDETYVFTKSMNKVRTIKRSSADEWVVERINSKKQMIVKERALQVTSILENET